MPNAWVVASLCALLLSTRPLLSPQHLRPQQQPALQRQPHLWLLHVLQHPQRLRQLLPPPLAAA